MKDKHIRIILEILREGIKKKDWKTIKYVEGVLNMHTIEAAVEAVKNGNDNSSNNK